MDAIATIRGRTPERARARRADELEPPSLFLLVQLFSSFPPRPKPRVRCWRAESPLPTGLPRPRMCHRWQALLAPSRKSWSARTPTWARQTSRGTWSRTWIGQPMQCGRRSSTSWKIWTSPRAATRRLGTLPPVFSRCPNSPNRHVLHLCPSRCMIGHGVKMVKIRLEDVRNTLQRPRVPHSWLRNVSCSALKHIMFDWLACVVLGLPIGGPRRQAGISEAEDHHARTRCWANSHTGLSFDDGALPASSCRVRTSAMAWAAQRRCTEDLALVAPTVAQVADDKGASG